MQCSSALYELATASHFGIKKDYNATKVGRIIYLFVLALFITTILARDVPENVKSFYDRVKNGKCIGGKILKDGFYSEYPGPKSFAYCQDDATGVLYLHGDGSKFANMDVDCDGKPLPPGVGRCGSSKDTQSETAFKYQVEQYSKHAGKEVSDLNANFIPYVVFGNQGNKKGYTTFHPAAHGVQPLSVMAVVCGDKLVYGVWGDTNGDDGRPLVGEASISLATACYGTTITGNNGHSRNNVLYVAFPGTIADTVNKSADWGAKSFVAFENSIEEVGNKLIEHLL